MFVGVQRVKRKKCHESSVSAHASFEEFTGGGELLYRGIEK